MKKILGAVTLVLALVSCGTSSTENKENQKLLFYAGLQEDHAALIADKFTKETGINTEFVRMSSGETLARLKAEKNNMVASVWYGGPIDAIIAANHEGLLENYISPTAKEIPDQFKDKDGAWTGIYVGYLGFVGNKALLEKLGEPMPTSWEELLKPKFKGELAVAHPGSSGTSYTMLATLVQLMGEEKAFEYLNKLDGQIRQYTKSGTAPGRMVGNGELALGITFLHDAIKYKLEGYKDIEVSVPSEGTGYEIGGVALLKNAPNPEGAKKFIDWVLTAPIQELGQTVGSFQFLTNVNAKNPKEADGIKDAKLIDYNFEWAGTHRKELVEKFTKNVNSNVPTK